MLYLYDAAVLHHIPMHFLVLSLILLLLHLGRVLDAKRRRAQGGSSPIPPRVSPRGTTGTLSYGEGRGQAVTWPQHPSVPPVPWSVRRSSASES